MTFNKGLILALAVVLSGCKIEIKAPENGRVSTESGAYSCEAGKTCEVDVVDLFFDETFVAQPAEGFVFKGWKKAQGSFCGGSRQVCHLFTYAFEGNEVLMGFLESDEVFLLEPVFVQPDDESLPKIDLSGNWSYVHRWGDCTASGEIFQVIVKEEGLYQTRTPESQKVSSIDPCEFVIAGTLSSTAVGPVSSIRSVALNEFQLQAAYDEFFSAQLLVEVISLNKYRVTVMQDGVANKTTYTRIP